VSEADRSPIKDKPLRLPGQSLEEERRSLLEDKFENWALAAAFLLALACLEWFRYFWPLPPQPWLMTACALAMLGLAARRFRQILPTLKQLRQGIEGEKAVGQFLERLRSDGYQVFHDVVAEGFNIDHVLIGPAGVFTVETKTWSKPARGDARICYDGNTLTVAGRTPDRDPLVQARSQARWLKNLLTESTGRQFAVRPVLVFPGWYVEAGPDSRREIWVMEPKGLPAFLAADHSRLDSSDVKLAAFHLGRFIRSAERERAAR
jgi:hypothetical protein